MKDVWPNGKALDVSLFFYEQRLILINATVRIKRFTVRSRARSFLRLNFLIFDLIFLVLETGLYATTP